MNLQKMLDIFGKGMDLNSIALLYIVRDGEYIEGKNIKFSAIYQGLERKGYVKEGRITMEGEEMLAFVEGKGEPVKIAERTKGLDELYENVMKRAEELTGKKQIRTEIFGKTYSYFPNKYDFTSRLKQVVGKYGMKDMERVEKVIIGNIEKCHKTKKWYPLLIYYFTKDGVSTLANEYNDFEEIKQIEGEQYDGTNI